MGADDAGRRLDRILRRLLAENSQGAVEGALRKGLVRLNGKKAAAAVLTKEGDLLSCATFLLAQNQEEAPKARALPQENAVCPFPVVFKNEHLLFIDKPAGVPVHGEGSVAEFFASQKTASLAFVPAPLHRLDKGTSGLLAVSQSLAGARWFSQKIKTHEIKKFYWGIALGRLEAQELWEDMLEVSGGQESADEAGAGGRFFTTRVAKAESGSKAVLAKTVATPIKRGLLDGKEITLVQYQIFTGRKRQIRAQTAARGLALLGDKAYGQDGSQGRFYLRAMRLEFPENDLGLPPAIDAPRPQDFLAFFKDSR